ncbi:MAG: hypothetical protein LKF61_04125 [Eggerthellaceae bacterium]|jgi:pilin isopeptide linkage protein|nr:hypothetical protein [Eggerthellaceae bacterium]
MKRLTCIRILFVTALTFGLLCGMTTVAEAADQDVASVDGVTYSSYEAAWAAVPNDGTIDVLADWNTNSQLTVAKSKTITVNLNGHMINRHLASDNSSSSTKNGEVFYVSDSATLNVNGGSTSIVHSGRLSNGVWYADPSTNQTDISGGVIAGGYSDNGAGGIQMNTSSKVNLSQVTLCGNMSDDYWLVSGGGYGGAIEMNGEYSKLTLTGSRITFNYADINGGGLYVNHASSSIKLDANSSINYNTAKNYGGGIYTDASKLELEGGSVANNSCGKDGGGIYINHKTTNVTNMQLVNNTAGGYGGGAYIDAGGSATLIGCTIKGNIASQGGGVYDNGDNNSLGNCTIKDNHAKEDYGGGVYVSSVDKIGLSGTMIINENTAGDDKHSNNLHLGDTGSNALITSMPDYTSHIGIYTTRNDGRSISTTGTYMTTPFSADRDGWYIDWVDAAHGGDRQLLWKQGTAPAAPTSTTVSPGTSTVGTYKSNSLIKGTFSFASNTNDTDDLDSVFYYSDGLFSDAPTTYDSHLATMSMALAMSAFGANAGNDTADYTNKFSHVKQLLADIGCDDSKTFIKTTYTEKPRTDTIAAAIGQKNITVNGNDDYVLVPIAIRGAGYESEWASNVTVGETGEEAGFANAADQVTTDVENYIKSDPALLEKAKAGKVKFWVTGFSRAAATANLTAKRLVDGIHIYDDSSMVYTGNQVYGYCFAAPQGGIAADEYQGAAAYNCIHNIINKTDIVPLVAMSQMGFKRYGVDHYMPGSSAGDIKDSSSTSDNNRCDNTQLTVDYTTGGDYQKQRALMLNQLTAVNHTFTFEDYYHTAVLNVVTGSLGIDDMTTEVNLTPSSDAAEGHIGLAEGFEPKFMQNVLEWNFGTDTSVYRYDYATKKNDLCGSDESLQTALSNVAGLMKSKSPSDLAGIKQAASGMTGNLGYGDIWSVYWNVIRKWTDLSKTDKEGYLNEFWGLLMDSNGYSPCVGDYLTYKEQQQFAKDWPVIGDFLFTLISKDHQHEVTVQAAPTTQEYQVYMGTLLHNATTIAQSHCPEVYFSWMRSYDDFYTNDTTSVTVDTSNVTVAKPTANLPDGAITGDDPLELSTTSAGGGIYYRVRMQAGGRDTQSDWKLYQGSIPLTQYKTYNTTYTVEAYTMEYGKMSETATFTYKLGKSTLITSVAIDANLQYYQDTTSKQKMASTVTLDPKSPDGTYFVKWAAKTYNEETNTWTNAPEVLGDQASNPYATFTMPEAETAVKAEYAVKINKVWLNIDTSTFGTGTATLPSTAQWHCLNTFGYHSSGWPKDTSSMYDEYDNGIPIPITWTKGETSGSTTAYTASVTFFPDPAQHFTTSGVGLPSDFLFASQDTVVINGQQEQNKVTANADGSLTIAKTFQITNPPVTHTVTVKCFDEYAQALMPTETRTYEYTAGDSVSLPAPSVDDETFVSWEKDGTYITDANASDCTLTFTMPDADIELQSDYIPVIKKMDLTITAPKAGEALPTSISGCTVTVTTEHTIPVDDFALIWTPKDITAGYTTSYTATVRLSDKALETLKSKFLLADNAVVTVNGTAVSADSISKDDKGNTLLTIVFPTTDDPNLVNVINPDSVEGIAHGTSLDTILSNELTSTVAIITENGKSLADVTWNSADGYDPTNLDEQTCTAHGTIALPDGVKNGHNVSLDVTEEFTVDAMAYTVTNVVDPDDPADQEHGVALDDIPLPSTTSITTDPAGPTSAQIVWDTSNVNYDPDQTEEQTIVIPGKIVLPGHTTIADESLLNICAVVTIKAKEYSPLTIDTGTQEDALLKQEVEGSGFDSTTFNFSVTPLDDAPVSAQTTGTTTAETAGTQIVDFGTITFTHTGTYRYVVKQTSAASEGWTCDTEEKVVTVTVSDKDGTLAATVEPATITDTYSSSPSPTPTPTPDPGSNPGSGSGSTDSNGSGTNSDSSSSSDGSPTSDTSASANGSGTPSVNEGSISANTLSKTADPTEQSLPTMLFVAIAACLTYLSLFCFYRRKDKGRD